MQKLANISAFESLQNQANGRMGFPDPLNVFNENEVEVVDEKGKRLTTLSKPADLEALLPATQKLDAKRKNSLLRDIFQTIKALTVGPFVLAREVYKGQITLDQIDGLMDSMLQGKSR